VYGITFYGYPYTFGVVGYRFDQSYNRTGGTFGASSTSATAWGCLGYRTSVGIHVGVYGTSTGSGSGFLSTNYQIHVGGGFYGGLVGSWSRGELMGQISCGEAFASYNLGNEYTSGFQAQIISNNDKKIVAYNTVSTEMKVYHDGFAKLSNGSAFVTFPSEFKNAIQDNKPVVTVSPLGMCNGLYISDITPDGFEVRELNNGNSNVEFSYIVIAKRAAPDNNKIPDFILTKEFDEKMKGFMFNESNTKENATPVWWDGTKLRYEPIPEGPKPDKEKELLRHKSPEELEKERKLEETLKKLREGK
ncbi:MAG: hypothetical protein N3A01_09195, partial [Bacteroidales bacterium]|nr:hypothetical protein [Bacteroidales bacterium]